MENEKNYHDRIDSYLRNELSEEERLLFEESLRNDPNLREEYLIHRELCAQVDDSCWISDAYEPNEKEVKELEEYFRSDEAERFKSLVEKSKNDYNTQSRKDYKIKWIVPIIAAASVSIIILLQLDLFSKSSEKLYSEYAQWNDLPSLPSRSAGNVLSRGQFLFEQKQYDESFDLFAKYEEENKEISSPILLYLGISALELDKYQQALDSFDKLIKSESIDRSMGYWYKALTYLKMGHKGKAKAALKEIISKPSNFNYEVAKELLSEL